MQVEQMSAIGQTGSFRNLRHLTCVIPFRWILTVALHLYSGAGFKKKNHFTEIQLIYNVVLISAVQQSDSVIHIHILFHSLFHYGSSQDVKYNSLTIHRTLLFIHSLNKSLHKLSPILPSPRFLYKF